MKKLAIIFSLFALLVGCEQVNDLDQIGQTGEIENNGAFSGTLPETIYVSIEQVSTRTYLDREDMSVKWHKGDAISYITGTTHSAYLYKPTGANKYVEFEQGETHVINPGTEGTYFVYPYSVENNSVVDNTLQVVYPAIQTYAEGSFGKGANLMVDASNEANADLAGLRNAGGCLIIKLYDTNEAVCVKSIKLTALGDVKIAGPAAITINNAGIPTVTMRNEATSEVTLDCSNGGEGVALGATKEEATEFWFALPHVTMTDGMKIEVTATDNSVFEMQTTKSVAIERSMVQPMAALKFEANTPYQIFYTTSDGNAIDFSHLNGKTPFDTAIVNNSYINGNGVITLESKTTTINQDAFRGTKVTSITLPETLTTIDAHAFYGTPLTEVTIPGSVSAIGMNAFQNCTSLKSISFLPSSQSYVLKIRATPSGESFVGPFSNSALQSININRRIDYIQAYSDLTIYYPAEPKQGLFAYVAPTGTTTSHTTSVTLGEQVNTIFPYMFGGQPIISITIPNSVTTIDRHAFYGNTKLESITIVGSVNSILEDAFEECSGLKSITFEASPTNTPLKIGKQGYSDSISIVTDLGPFYNSPLTTINLNRELEYYDFVYSKPFVPDQWDEGLFANEYWNDEDIVPSVTVTLGNQLRTISDYMFNWVRISSLTIPEGVTSIGEYAFNGCSTMTSISIPEGVTSIGEYAFDGCSTMTSISIPGTVTTIGNYAFDECESLSSVTFKSSPTPLTIGHSDTSDEYGPFFYSPLSYIYLDRELVPNDKYAAVLAEDDEWGNGLFANEHYQNVSEVSVTLGSNVKTIHKHMFNMLNIKSINIPSSVTTIKTDAFHGCEKLTSLTFQSGTADLQIGPTLEGSNEYGPFYDTALETLVLNRNLVPTYTIDGDEEGLFSEIETLKNVTLGSNVKTIGNRMFLETGITYISIPGSVTKIELCAFNNCESLSSIRFEPSATNATLSICQGLYGTSDLAPFYYSPLQSVYIDRNLYYYSEENTAFTPDANDEYLFTTKTDALKTVTFGGNVTNVFNNMFNKCPNITSVTFEAGTSNLTLGYNTDYEGKDDGGNDVVGKGLFLDAPYINTVVLNRNINYNFDQTITYSDYSSLIRASIFNNNHTLTNITIGENVTSLPDYAFAGAGLSGKDINLPSKLQTIGKYAFYDAQINGGIYIPASVTTIKDGAFRMNNNSTITCLGTKPATIEGTPFYGHYTYIISVPAEAVEAYQTAWTSYSNQIQAIIE